MPRIDKNDLCHSVICVNVSNASIHWWNKPESSWLITLILCLHKRIIMSCHAFPGLVGGLFNQCRQYWFFPSFFFPYVHLFIIFPCYFSFSGSRVWYSSVVWACVSCKIQKSCFNCQVCECYNFLIRCIKNWRACVILANIGVFICLYGNL